MKMTHRLIMLTLIMVLVISGACGTQDSTDTNAKTIVVWHDDERLVTCWVYGTIYKGGLSCIPDNQLQQ
jgi:maltose-binding protein MalE